LSTAFLSQNHVLAFFSVQAQLQIGSSTMTDAPKTLDQLRKRALELGLDAVGAVALPVALRKDYYQQWIASGQHGQMTWMERNNERRLDPRQIVEEARSVLVLGLNYYQPDPVGRRFRIAKYALGDDYHNCFLKRLQKICRFMRDTWGSAQRPYVDTGPVLEKPLAELAGLGWQGKSTILLNQEHGTWLFLGVIISTLELPGAEPVKDRCGSCTACIAACPTAAITAPYQLDARKCIAYLTIEHDGPIPLEFRRAIGDRLFGCDECLDVCPWNRFAKRTRELRFSARDLPELRQMLSLTEENFRELFRGSAMRRLKRERLLRNACVVLGNVGTADDLPALRACAETESPMVAEHAQWAIGEMSRRSELAVELLGGSPSIN
jgi:epoxyqueuosine reductase